MSIRIVALLMLPCASCGYSVGSRGLGHEPRRVVVAPVREAGIDIDAAALVSSAVRRAITRTPAASLIAAGSGRSTLDVELIDTQKRLAPMADPGQRAAQYRVTVRLRGKLVSPSGRTLWTSAPVDGNAYFVSTPGPIERLDGAGRRALAKAAEEAADRLVLVVPWHDSAKWPDK